MRSLFQREGFVRADKAGGFRRARGFLWPTLQHRPDADGSGDFHGKQKADDEIDALGFDSIMGEG